MLHVGFRSPNVRVHVPTRDKLRVIIDDGVRIQRREQIYAEAPRGCDVEPYVRPVRHDVVVWQRVACRVARALRRDVREWGRVVVPRIEHGNRVCDGIEGRRRSTGQSVRVCH